MLKKEVKRYMRWIPAVQTAQRDEVNLLIVPDYTVSIASNNTTYGTVNKSSVTVDEWTPISASSNKLTIWTTVVTATAKSGYEFSSWGELPAKVTQNLSVTATFTGGK
jgi:hypothetical protein